MVRVTWDGLDELRADLHAMPNTLAAESHAAVRTAAENTREEVLTNYPVGHTGHLRAGVSIDEHEAPGIFSVDVLSKAPHAHLWEKGTKVRTKRGQMPAHESQSLQVVAERHRHAMELELADIVRGQGFTVTGDFV